MTPRPIIIDTDPGQDDAVAMLLALASPEELEILGVTAVAGNVPLSLTEKNARRICELAGKPDTPVYAGCARPMVRTRLVTAEHVHGKTGLDGPDLPEPSMALKPGHAVDSRFSSTTITCAAARAWRCAASWRGSSTRRSGRPTWSA